MILGLVFLFIGRLLFGSNPDEGSRFSLFAPFALADAPGGDGGDGIVGTGTGPEDDGSGAEGGDSSGAY